MHHWRRQGSDGGGRAGTSKDGLTPDRGCRWMSHIARSRCVDLAGDRSPSPVFDSRRIADCFTLWASRREESVERAEDGYRQTTQTHLYVGWERTFFSMAVQ